MLSRAGTAGRAQPGITRSFKAPTRGLVLNENLAAMKPGGANILDNWIPTSRSVRVRRGSIKRATVGSGPVESLMSYFSGSTRKLFAASNGSIYDITSPVDAVTPPAASVSGLTGNYWTGVNYRTSGGSYLVCVNGADSLRLYDGASWATITGVSVPAITGVTTSTLVHAWVYRNRLYFVQINTQDAWYLAVDSIGGAATKFTLNGIFQKGGNLHFGGTWSLDAGDGIDDKCVFVSDLGEIVVYQGSYPGSTDWSLVGRYDGSPPLGRNAKMSAGGDLLMATKTGLVAVSASITKDPGAIGLAAVSRPIEPLWTPTAEARDTYPWEIAKWTERQIALVSCPVAESTQDTLAFVVNLETGAWATISGWDTRSLVLHEGVVYFGTNTGTILEADTGGQDNGSPFYAKLGMGWDHCGSEGAYKEFVSARAMFRASRPFNPALTVSVDYAQSFDTPPAAAAGVSSSLWDEGLWDVALWDTAGAEATASIEWQSQANAGIVVSPQVQITSGATSSPEVELTSFDLVYKLGAVVT